MMCKSRGDCRRFFPVFKFAHEKVMENDKDTFAIYSDIRRSCAEKPHWKQVELIFSHHVVSIF